MFIITTQPIIFKKINIIREVVGIGKNTTISRLTFMC